MKEKAINATMENKDTSPYNVCTNVFLSAHGL